MKIIGVIPARYGSSRLPGKPLADICGRPMIWWVYQQATKVAELTDVVVATDDDRVVGVCNDLHMSVVMTSKDGNCLIDRLYELSNRYDYDYYVSVNGDEPLIESENIPYVLPDKVIVDKPIVRGIMRVFKDPVEVIDPGNMKLVCAENGRLLYISRSPIPYPHKTTLFTYKKYVGVECYNKAALNFYASTQAGIIEKIEDLGTLRFLENGIDVYYKMVESESLSVDTERDLERVRELLGNKLKDTPPPREHNLIYAACPLRICTRLHCEKRAAA